MLYPLDQILSALFRNLFHFNTHTALMSNTSSLRLTPSKRQQERQNSIGLARNEKVKYKVEKVKPLHKTPSGREPKQKKKLKKEELQSYDIEDVVDDISNTNSEDDNVNGEEIGSLTEESLQLKVNDQSQTNVSISGKLNSHIYFWSLGNYSENELLKARNW